LRDKGVWIATMASSLRYGLIRPCPVAGALALAYDLDGDTGSSGYASATALVAVHRGPTGGKSQHLFMASTSSQVRR